MLAMAAALAVAALTAMSAAACEPSSGTDRDKGMRELDELEELFQPTMPVIPLSQRVGCDACPGLCGFHDLHILPEAELVRRFRHNAVELVRENPDGLVGGPHWRQLERLACIAMRIGDDAERQLVALLDDAEPGVRFSTAWITISFGLDAATVRAANVMQELAGAGLPLSFQAWHVRRMWEEDASSNYPQLPGRANRPWRTP